MNDTLNKQTAYALLRIAMGVNFLGHGLARIPKLPTFSDGMVKSFEKSWLPEIIVKYFGIALPFAEFIIGLMLILGLLTRFANIAGAFVIIILLFGSSTIENWESMGSQMIYAFIFYFLIHNVENDQWCLDKILK